MNRKSREGRVLLCCLSLLACAGCATVTGYPDAPKNIVYAGGMGEDLSKAEADALARYHGDTDVKRVGMTPAQYRNSFIYSEMGAIDDSFSSFVKKVRTQRSAFNIASSGTVLTLNGLAATTGGAGTKAALAAASAGILGQKGAVDQELFNAQTLVVLIVRMKAARLAALVPITAGMKQSVAAYPLEAAIVQLHAYRDAGNLLSTLDEISNDAGEKATAAREEVSSVTRDANFRDSRGEAASIETRISKLSDAETLQLVFIMQTHLAARPQAMQEDLKQVNPSASRFHDPTAARSFLYYWLENYGESADEFKQWTDALGTVGG